MIEPLSMETAPNGGTSKARNADVPVAPGEIAAQALAVVETGSAIVHTHIGGMNTHGDAAAARYIEGDAPILAARPDAILWATVA